MEDHPGGGEVSPLGGIAAALLSLARAGSAPVDVREKPMELRTYERGHF